MRLTLRVVSRLVVFLIIDKVDIVFYILYINVVTSIIIEPSNRTIDRSK